MTNIFKHIISAVVLVQIFSICCSFAGVPSYVFPEADMRGRLFSGIDRMSDGTAILTFGEKSGSSVKMFVCLSTDDLKTWSSPTSFATVQDVSLGLQRRPRVLLDKNGILHAVFEDIRSGSLIRVFHCSSTDNGINWSQPSLIRPSQVSVHEDFCSAAIDSSNRLIVTFLTNGVDSLDEHEHVFITTSDDGGTSWSMPAKVDRFDSGGSCECCAQNVAVGPENEIAVAFRSNIDNRRDVYVAVSTNNGVSFETPVVIQSSPWHVNACPTTGPSICYNAAGDLSIVWWDARDSRKQPVAYYARLRSKQVTTPLNIDLSSATASEAEYPSVATTPDGETIAVAWFGTSGVHISRSDNFGESFNTKVIDPTVINNGCVFVALTLSGTPKIYWQGNRGAVSDLMEYFDVNAAGVNANNKNDFSYQLDNDRIYLHSQQLINSVEVYDILGNLVCSIVDHSSDVSVKLPMSQMLFISTTVGEDRNILKIIR